MLTETAAAPTFTIYPILALLAVYAVGWWLVKKNHVVWENGRMEDYWPDSKKPPIKRWKDGSFARFHGQWENIWLGSVIFGSVAAILGGIIVPNPYVPFLFGTFGFVGAFTGWTDLWTRRAPVEMSHLGLFALFPVAVWGVFFDPNLVPSKLNLSFMFGTNNNLYQFLIFAAVMPGLMFIFSAGLNALGMADVRGLWMAAFAFSWWVGLESMLLISVASLFIQLLAGIPANIFKWGELRKSPFPWKKKPSRAIPWLPAIGLTFTYGTLLMLVLPPVVTV